MKKFANYKRTFEDVLLKNFVPFWTKNSPDKEYGGYLCGFNRKGELFFEDKSVWHQGRSLWMFSKLYNEFGKNEKWLECAKCGYDFINKYCFSENRHMYFKVTRDGKPLVLRRYYFSEAFAIMGYVEYYKATKDEKVKTQAVELYDLMLKYYTTPNYFAPKENTETRQKKGHSIVMIMMNVAQSLREIVPDEKYNLIIGDCIGTLKGCFIKSDERALLETVGCNGERFNSPEGRLINPGHSIETAWFLMREAVYRQDRSLMEMAINVTEWSLERGWDEKYGGIFYFVDVEKKPVLSLEWDMKLIWPHCEAMLATVLAYWYSGEKKYFEWFEKVCDYVFAHFPDNDYPEWFGHLHRDGTPISGIKGSDWKGPFHNVRAFMLLTQFFDKMDKGLKLFDDVKEI